VARKRKPVQDEEVANLYGLPLEDFIAERDALAKRLRGEGSREDAERVRKLKKPSRSAWAINQGVRADSKAAQRLIEAAEHLEGAQRKALSGKASAPLRDAMAAQQHAIEGMVDAVRTGVGSQRLSTAAVDRARETLRATAGDRELQAELAAGRITRDREAVGFGGPAPPAVSRPARPKRTAADAEAGRRKEAERKVKRATRSLDVAAKRVTEARKRLDRAQRALDAAQAQHDDADRHRAERQAELEAAENELGELANG
jgi:hypothetical protein